MSANDSAAAQIERYVRTPEARQRVAGHETEVLDALGIPWREGRPHIQCPYPDHGGDDDWRWDEKAGRAHCTCSPADSIFDVVMKCEGVAFPDAKVRVAEIIGAEAIIKQTSGKREYYLKSTAEALLQPPAERRDDEIVRNYLATRLRIPADQVLMPTTRVAGIEDLEYWEAGSSKAAAPTLVGKFPCAVFETLAADGRRHAHRIFTAPLGRGKADLGKRKGVPRKAKKSAKVAEGDDTAGRSVIWGDVDGASTVIVAEGIETGAAVAQALAQAVRDGKVMVAAAISAVGVEAFEPWRSADLLIVAADRDEEGNGDRPASLRGGQAARRIGLRLHDRMRVKIAMPGSNGSKTDWLDVFEAEGEEAVAEGLRAAVTFVPTDEELQRRDTRREQLGEVERFMAEYPLPELDTLTLRYGHTGSGKMRIHKVTVDKQGVVTSVPIASPFGVIARLRELDREEAYGLRLKVEGMNGQPRLLDVTRGAFTNKGGEEVKTSLFAAGLRTEDDGLLTVVNVLRAADPDREIAIVSRPGWHQVEGWADRFFVTPGGEIIGAPADATVELAAATRMTAMVASGGSLEGWKTATTVAATTIGCEHWILGLLAGFAGTLIDLTQMDTCGIDFTGLSSAGKSTAQRIAASVWSVPDVSAGGSLFQSARSTSNALEAAAARANGTVLSLDEMAHVKGREIAAIIYMIAGGSGKARMKSDASSRQPLMWRTFTVLSGEVTIEEAVKADGGDFLAGMAVRIVDVDVTGVNRAVPQPTLNEIAGVRANYGHAGPVFARYLIETERHRDPDALRARISATADTIAGEGQDAATRRAALPLATLLVAGELAQAAGLVASKVNINAAVMWAWARFQGSSNAEVLDPDQQALNNIRTWIISRWNVTIKNVETGQGGSGSQKAEGWYNADAVYLPKNLLKAAAGDVMKESQVAEILDKGGALFARKTDKVRHLEYVRGLGSVSVYALRRSQFGMNSDREGESPNLTVVNGGRSDDWRSYDNDPL